MEFKVRLFLGDQLLDPSDYSKVYIHCKDVDRIVNDIYERNLRWREQNGLPAPEEAIEGPLPEKKPSVLKALEEKKEEVKVRPKKPPARRKAARQQDEQSRK